MALRQVQRDLPPRRTALLGLSAAFLFAAQMVNFPVAGGTSGHLIGSTLVTSLLWPAAGIVVVTTVLIVQCFLFADGGVVALGANVFNMALVGCIVSHVVIRTTKRLLPGHRGEVTGVAFAGWCAVVVGATSCAAQLAWSGTVSWTAAFPAMTLLHMLIGVGEGLISALVYMAVVRTRPDLANAAGPAVRPGQLVLYGLAIAAGIAIFLAPFASTLPDGLESVAARLGFEQSAELPAIPAPIPDYETPGVNWAIGATAIAGLTGTVVVFALACVLGRLLVPGRATARSSESAQ
jgi:cobalt/nickel transport system permease protein